MFDELITLYRAEIIYKSTCNLIQLNGEVFGDLIFKEIDTRFSFSAVAILYILNKKFNFVLPIELLSKVKNNILLCYFDGCFSASIN